MPETSDSAPGPVAAGSGGGATAPATSGGGGGTPGPAAPGSDDGAPAPVVREGRGPLAKLLATLPRGGSLPTDSWRSRHKVIVVLLWIHVPLLVGFGIYGGFDPVFSNAYYEPVGVQLALLEGGVISLFALLASWPRLSRRIRAVAASVGLVTCSAVLTQFSGGFIEAHFHFFVMLGVIAMYLDWIPFLLAVGYVAVHHGTVGTFAPDSVYNHPAAIAHPWKWAFIHAFFVLGLSVAQISHWRMTENARARTESVLESAGDGILGLDASGNIAFSNPAASDLLGLERDKVDGRPFREAVPLEGATDDPTDTLHDGVRRRGSGELRINGSTRPVDWTSMPVQRADVPVGAVVTLRDVTEQRAAEQDRAYLASIVEASRDAILGLDLDGRIVTWNGGAEEVYGYKADEAIGQSIRIVAPEGEPEEVEDILERLLRGESVTSLEAVRRRKDGAHVTVSISASPLRDSDGAITGISSIVRDITAQREAEAQRALQAETERQLEHLKEQDEFKSRFINAAAHELNTPLTPINIYLRILQKADLDSMQPKHREAIKVLERNFKRFSRLVADLLDSARIQGGRLTMESRPLDVGEEVVREAVESFEAPAREAGVDLATEIEPGLEVMADAQRLSQVVYNLLNNALKFTPEGGHVTVRTRRDGEDAVVEVADDGAGLSDEQIGALFQPFSQVHDHHEATQKGTGLGLYLSRAILDLHDGEIWCESDGPEKGSRFMFRLPLTTKTPVAATPT